MTFSPDGARILVEYETNLFVVDSKGIEQPIVVQPFNALGGWLDSKHFVGTKSNLETCPVLIWDLKNLSNPEKVFDGVNRMGGPPSKKGTFVFANTAHPNEVALATFPAKSPIQWVRSPTPSPDKWDLAPMVDSQLSVLVQMIEYGDGDSFSTHFHFQSLRTNWPPSQKIYPNLNVQSKALSPVGDHFAFSEGQEGRLTVLSGRAFDESTNLSLSIVRALAFSPDGTQLASGGDDEQVRIHSSKTLEVLRTFKGHPSSITSLAWSQDGTRLASGDTSGELRVWDLTQVSKESDLTDGLKAGGLPVRIVVQNSGFLLATSGTNRTVEILDARTLAHTKQLPQAHTPIRWDGQELWMLRGNPDALVHHDLASGVTTNFEILNAFGDILGEVNSAGRMILFDRGNHVLFTSLPPTSELRFQATHSGLFVNKADISDDGKRAATVGDHWLDIWDVQSGTRIHAYRLEKELYSVAFQKGSAFCVVGCNNHELCVINTNTGEQAGKIDTLLDQNFDLILPAGLDRVFSGGSSGKINVSESTSNRSLVVLEHPELRQRKGEHRIRRLAYNPVLNDLYAMTDGGILARWRMAPEPVQH